MRPAPGVAALVIGGGAGLAAIALGGAAFLLAHRTIPDWLLPLAAIVAVATTLTRCEPAPTAGSRSSWHGWLLVALAMAGAAVIGYGALATPSRHWDGAAMWDVKAEALANAPTLEQPCFRESAIYCHSRDYPLLQPLTIALIERWGLPGRLLFAFAWLTLVGAVVAAARAAGHSSTRVLAFGGAIMLTPIMLAPTSGGFDSGYGDGLLAAAMATIAFGVTTRAALPIGLGCVVAVLQKPEGLPYCLALTAACWLVRDRRLWLAAGGATAVAGTLVMSLTADLRTFGAESQAPVWALLGAGMLATLWLADRLFTGRLDRVTFRLAVMVAAGITIAVAAGVRDPELVPRVGTRLHQLPRIVGAEAAWAFGDRFALTFALPALLAVARRGRALPSSPALGIWLASAIGIACLPFLVLPLGDLAHHLRSTMPRVLLHWTGVAWIFTVAHWRLHAGAAATAPVTAASAGT